MLYTFQLNDEGYGHSAHDWSSPNESWFAFPNRLLAENKGTWHLENQSKSYHHSPTGEMPGMRMNGISDVYFNGEVLP